MSAARFARGFRFGQLTAALDIARSKSLGDAERVVHAVLHRAWGAEKEERTARVSKRTKRAPT